MRSIIADWGTSRFRAFLVEGETVLDRVSSPEGIASLKSGEHRDVFLRHCDTWLAAHPHAPVALVGMVGSREGWAVAPYASLPAGPEEIAAAMMPVDLGDGRQGWIVPGLSGAPSPGAVDVMRGEETLALGGGVDDGLVCLPGTHSKWVEMREGRIRRFASFMTGEMYALLREHSMIGRPAAEPEDAAGFALGLDAVERDEGAENGGAGLLHLLFGARAAAVTGGLTRERLGPYLSGLLTASEVRGALALFGHAGRVTLVGPETRTGLYREALGRHGIDTAFRDPEAALFAGLARILARRS